MNTGEIIGTIPAGYSIAPLPQNGPCIKTVSGEIVPWIEAFAQCQDRMSHGLNTIYGYIVRRTFPGEPNRMHEDVEAIRGDNQYSHAIEMKYRVRAGGDGAYAVVDTVYSCGCRSAG